MYLNCCLFTQDLVEVSLIIFSPGLCFCTRSYGRVYAADPYNHTLTPAATYSVGAMVRPNVLTSFFLCITSVTHWTKSTVSMLLFSLLLLWLLLLFLSYLGCCFWGLWVSGFAVHVTCFVWLDVTVTNQQPQP